MTKGRLKGVKAFGPLFLLEIALDGSLRASPGQFAMVEVPDGILMRPFSIFSLEGHLLKLLVQPKGRGTRALVDLKVGTVLRTLLPLGRGYPVMEGGDAWLVAGGTGIASLFPLAVELSKGLRDIELFWGAKDHRWFPTPILHRLKEAGVKVKVCTEDGSMGEKGLVTEVLPSGPYPKVIYACGPEGMIEELARRIPQEVPLYVSLEQRMACGLGVCRSCTLLTPHGPRSVCKDGPVFRREELLWKWTSGCA